MNYPAASRRGIKKANTQGKGGTDPRVGVLNRKENKREAVLFWICLSSSLKIKSLLLFQTLFYRLCFFLISGFFKKCKHIFFVGFHTRLIKWIHIKDIAAESAGKFKKVNQLP